MTLLMLQSIKRAYRLDRKNCKLHSCLIRFHEYILTTKDLLPKAVREVVDKEVRPMLDGKAPKELNDLFLQKNANCLEAVYQGAKMLYHLDSSKQSQALALVMNFNENMKDINIQVIVIPPLIFSFIF